MNVQERQEFNSPYEKNETMKFLGKQYTLNALEKNQFKAIDDIEEARPHSFTTCAAIDIFMLGYVEGKRAERRRRSGGMKRNG